MILGHRVQIVQNAVLCEELRLDWKKRHTASLGVVRPEEETEAQGNIWCSVSMGKHQPTL